MYEQAIVENDRLREKLRKSEEDLRETKQTLEKINTVVSYSYKKDVKRSIEKNVTLVQI